MKILVTGANGFVGSNLVETLLEKGHTVRCLVHKNITWLDKLPKDFASSVEIVRGSIAQIETLHPAVKNVDIVFHSAGILRAVNAETYYRINQTGTKNLIEAVYRLNPNVSRFVYISSQAAMGPSPVCNPRDPQAKCDPVSEYGRSKLAGETEALKFKNKIPVTVLRPSAIYGPRDRDIFPFFRFVAKHKIFPIPGMGRDCRVQLLFVRDLAEICAIITSKGKLHKDVYFLSENVFYTWQEIGAILAKAAGFLQSRASGAGIEKIRTIKIPFFFLKSLAGISEIIMRIRNKPAAFNRDKLAEFCQTYWISDSSASEIEFALKYTSLETGARITYNWYKENGWL